MIKLQIPLDNNSIEVVQSKVSKSYNESVISQEVISKIYDFLSKIYKLNHNSFLFFIVNQIDLNTANQTSKINPTRRTTQVNVNQNKQVQLSFKTNLVLLANTISSIMMYFY